MYVKTIGNTKKQAHTGVGLKTLHILGNIDR